MTTALKGVLNRLKAFVLANPVRVASYLAAVVVFVAAKFGVLVQPEPVTNALLLVIPILVGGEVGHQIVASSNK